MLASGLSVSPKIRNAGLVWYYIACLVYATLTKKRYKTKTWGRKVIQRTAETFWKRLNELREKVMDKDGVNRKV